MHGVQLARGYALLGAITGIAPVVAPIFGGVLALFMGWRGIFIALAAVSILLVLVAYLKVPETLPSDKRGESGLGSALSDIGLLFTNRAFMAYVLMIACGGGMLFAYLGSSSFILVDGFGFSPTLFSIVFAINSVGIFVLAFWGRHLVTRTGPNRLLWWGQAITFVGSVLVFIGLASSVLAVLLVGFFLAIAANTWVFANATAIGFDVAPARAGAASAMLGVAGFAVGGLLAPLTGMGTVALGVMMVIFTGGGLLVHQFVARPYLARST
jgi:DHA1 family bicyclomycin/chloramphenicol resistance-like MFS transporter